MENIKVNIMWWLFFLIQTFVSAAYGLYYNKFMLLACTPICAILAICFYMDIAIESGMKKWK